MGCLRPATPGFIVTLVATVLLAVVVFCVPYFKSIYFLKASVTVQNVTGNITFGTLGYCIELPGNTTCSKPSIGYELGQFSYQGITVGKIFISSYVDINGLVGNGLPVQIPQVVVKWITYLLFLHVIALVGAAGSAVFGLLAHVREMSMACCSTCISGFAAVVTLLAFIFDLVLFFVAKARISSVGSASIGTAIWLTLAAWILLFFSGCFYTLGRCCLGRRPTLGGRRDAEGGPDTKYAEQVRLDAVKAEADRKARQKLGESGLPAFYETQPLTTAHIEGDQVYLDGDRSDTKSELSPPQKQSYKGGYVPGPVGSRSVDDYYNHSDSSVVSASYPPQPQQPQQGPRRQRSETSNYVPSSHSPPPRGAAVYAAGSGQYHSSGDISSSQLLAPPGINPDPYGYEYGHAAGGSSCRPLSFFHLF